MSDELKIIVTEIVDLQNKVTKLENHVIDLLTIIENLRYEIDQLK